MVVNNSSGLQAVKNGSFIDAATARLYKNKTRVSTEEDITVSISLVPKGDKGFAF